MEDEGVLFEGLRLGSRRAFAALLADDDATMHRMAALYVGPDDPDRIDALVRQTWAVALPGLDMFTWQTTLRTWLTGILVTYGRARATTRDRACTTPADPAAPTSRPDGPVPWDSLAWSAWWDEDGWLVLERALAGLPLDQQEVLWLHDVEGWPWREVLDTLGHTATDGDRLLVVGRTALGEAVSAYLGQGAGDQPGRAAGVAHLLEGLRPRSATPVADPGLASVFSTWRRTRTIRPWRRWGWELRRRTRPVGRGT